MSLENFVILILCTHATLDDLMFERQKHKAVAVDIINYEAGKDYFEYREQLFDGQADAVKLMFVFGKNDSVIVRDEQDITRVQTRLTGGDC